MVLSSPAYSIGKSKRSLFLYKHKSLNQPYLGSDWKSGTYYVPGSGTYNPQKPERMSAPSWKIGTGQRGYGRTYPNPGPGQYDNNNMRLVIKKDEI